MPLLIELFQLIGVHFTYLKIIYFIIVIKIYKDNNQYCDLFKRQ